MTSETALPIEEQAPWEQVATLHQQQTKQPRVNTIAPRLQLRGDRVYLRALRAAEMTAWGDTSFFPADRTIVSRHLTIGR
jgi:hypothetical protein